MRILPVTSAALAPAAEADIMLMPRRAAYLPASATLLVADLHLGKAATFRSKGIPVPEGSAQKDLARLALLVAATRAKRLLVLGDLFHAKSGCTEEVFAEFTAARGRFSDTEVLLVAGNHDRSVGRLPAGLGIDCRASSPAAARSSPPPWPCRTGCRSCRRRRRSPRRASVACRSSSCRGRR